MKSCDIDNKVAGCLQLSAVDSYIAMCTDEDVAAAYKTPELDAEFAKISWTLPMLLMVLEGDQPLLSLAGYMTRTQLAAILATTRAVIPWNSKPILTPKCLTWKLLPICAQYNLPEWWGAILDAIADTCVVIRASVLSFTDQYYLPSIFREMYATSIAGNHVELVKLLRLSPDYQKTTTADLTIAVINNCYNVCELLLQGTTMADWPIPDACRGGCGDLMLFMKGGNHLEEHAYGSPLFELCKSGVDNPKLMALLIGYTPTAELDTRLLASAISSGIYEYITLIAETSPVVTTNIGIYTLLITEDTTADTHRFLNSCPSRSRRDRVAEIIQKYGLGIFEPAHSKEAEQFMEENVFFWETYHSAVIYRWRDGLSLRMKRWLPK